MGIRELRLLGLAAGLAFGTAANADGMTYAQYESEEKDLGARFEEAGTRCDAYVANARDVCLAEARGRQSVAQAELRAQYQPGARNLRRVLRARADALYAVAIERCDDEEGEDKDRLREGGRGRPGPQPRRAQGERGARRRPSRTRLSRGRTYVRH